MTFLRDLSEVIAMVEEKGPNIASNTSPVTDHCSPGDIGRIKDAALDFLETHQSAIDPNLYKDQAYVRRLRRKVDFAVIPFLMLCYVMNFLDKTLLGVTITALSCMANR